MFQDVAAFAFVPDIERSWTSVRRECMALPQDTFEPWVQREMYGTGWDVFGLIAWGHELPSAFDRCPSTAQLLRRIPGVRTAGFSRLRAGAHITPHRGWVTDVFRLHLGLVVPPDCTMTVAEVTRSWEEGRCLVFDDTSIHSSSNRSAADRYILLLDFLRPGCVPAADDLMPVEVRNMLAEKLRPHNFGR